MSIGTRYVAGWITPSEARRMKANLPERDHEIIDLLTASPVRASARYEDDSDDGEFTALFPPRTARERERRVMAAASARAARASAELTDSEADALFPPAPRP
jgi:hypothetical protein